MATFVTSAGAATWWPNLQTCMWCHPVVKCATNENGQLTPPGGQLWNKCIRTNYETLLEAQRIQGIESGTGIIFLTKIHLKLF